MQAFHRTLPTGLQSSLKRAIAANLNPTRAARFAPRRSLIAAPKLGDGPLLQRRGDRALPEIRPSRSLLYTIPFFLLALAGSTAIIFNYQKTHSSVVSSTLYALRTSPAARELLGDEITFKSKLPWIVGELDQLHGVIDIYYDVKGNKGEGRMHFKSVRKSRMGLFETSRWELIMKDGSKLQLLDDPRAADPFPQEAMV